MQTKFSVRGQIRIIIVVGYVTNGQIATYTVLFKIQNGFISSF